MSQATTQPAPAHQPGKTSTVTQLTLQQSVRRYHYHSVKNAFNHPINDGEVVNLNVTTNIGVEISPEVIEADFDWATTDPNKAAGFCEISFDDTPGSAKLYNTGTVVLVGITTDTEVIALIERIHKALREIGIPTEWNELEMKNIVVKFSAPNPDGNGVNLPAATIALDDIEYEPEHFAGAVYRTGTGKTCLLFSTGSVVVQGTESTLEAVQRREHLFEKLDAYDLLE